jgi:cyanophycinase
VPFPIADGIGTLFILGGLGTPQVVYDEFFRIAGGPRARVIHIPSATRRFPDIPDLREYYAEFYEQGPESFEFLHTYERAVAEQAEFAEPLNGATGVWMGGGDQNLLAELFLDTAVIAAINRLLERGGIVSGTSSGATIMSDRMICRGYEEVEFGQGFALYPRAIVDTHFTSREREKRVARSVLQHPDQIGVGIDENATLVIHGCRFGGLGKLGKSIWYHFADPPTKTVRRYRLAVGEVLELPGPVCGADPQILEECLRAHRPADVLTAEQMVE